MIIKTSTKINIFKSIIISILLLVASLLSFKKIRVLFPTPMINENKLVGFSQYYGYPFYFDTIFFFFIILLPVIVLLIFYFWEKRR